MGNFFSLSYWFAMRPGSLAPNVMIALLIFVVLLFLLIIVFTILKKNFSGAYYKVYDRLQGFCIGNTIIGFLLLFFTSQLVPVLSSRFWFLLWAAGMLFWFWFIFKHVKQIPEIRKQKQEEEEFKKYIP